MSYCSTFIIDVYKFYKLQGGPQILRTVGQIEGNQLIGFRFFLINYIGGHAVMICKAAMIKEIM
jgi:hypothetical protein